MIQNNTLIMLIGESGCGKTTVANRLEECGLKILQSYTTRAPRHSGERGHTFVSQTEFNNLEGICAYNRFDGNDYAATREQIDSSDVYVVDMCGLQSLKENYDGNKKLISFYIKTPILTRYKRMRERGDGVESVNKRIVNDFEQFRGVESLVDYIVKNDGSTNIDHIAQTILETIKASEHGDKHE